eukprot:scaffold1621_cov150-Pinguiococcus_pyrenoidosus.AAC.11
MHSLADREAIFSTPLRNGFSFLDQVKATITPFTYSTTYLCVFSTRHSPRRPHEAAGEARFAERISLFSLENPSVTNRSGAARNSGRRRGK